MTASVSNSREMLTAEEVHDITGVPVSTLHDWAAKRERGMQAPGPHHIRLSNGIGAGREKMSTNGSSRPESDPAVSDPPHRVTTKSNMLRHSHY